MSIDPNEFRARQRAMWSAGDWPAVAESIQPVADALVERLGIEADQDVLDVGTGSGNAALRAAERGARVVGADIAPDLFDTGRERAADAGVEIEWVEGDAAELPFADDSFDVAMTVFGAIFAPRHQAAADEFVRVCRPGGQIGICGWTPEGLNGQMLKVTSSAMPPQPGVEPPILWGDEDHVTALFEGTGVELSFERVMAVWEAESPEAWIGFLEQNLGPVIMAKAALSSSGAYEPIRDELVDLFAQYVREDGTFRPEAEYLRIVGRLSA